MNDTFKTLFIFLVFSVLTTAMAYAVSRNEIQNNWPVYRCNPMIMPMAGSLSPDGMSTSDNFTYCIQDVARSFAPTITAPLQYVQAMTIDSLNSTASGQESTLKNQNILQKNSAMGIGSVLGVFVGVVVEFKVMLARIADAQARMSAVMATLMYIVTSVQFTFQSMWNGIPGAMIRAFGSISA